MSLIRYKSLNADKRALLAIAVLLDGREAINYLGFDSVLDNSMQRIAEEISSLEPELRMPLLGTLLREAITELETNSIGRK